MPNDINVNMTPNPLDLQTLHCSQGDTGARKFKIKLHNNGEVIDTSNVKEQVEFPVYKGGTEELLPTNTSTPVTSPIDADIQYPQGLLTDQVFTYRESPTEEDGKAKVKCIRGNTLKWNQLVLPLSSMSAQNGTISVADNVATITSFSSITYLGIATSGGAVVLPKGGHKYLLTVEVKSPKALSSCDLWYGNGLTYIQENIPANTWTKVSAIVSYGTPTGQYVQIRGYGSFEQGDTLQVRNWNYFDLTAMGLDITDPSEFTSLFPLPYYQYDTGSLLSFKGTGIKTVGFNQWDEEWEVGAYSSANGSKVSVSDRIRNKNPNRIFPSTDYFASKGIQLYFYDANMNYLKWDSFSRPSIFTSPSNAYYMNFNGLANSGATYNNDICINISDTERNGTYEPYTSSTLSLPISTYFPQGMNRVNDVYDELTPSKAVKRLGMVDLGSLTWEYNSSLSLFFTNISDAKYVGSLKGRPSVCALLSSTYGQNYSGWANQPNKSISVGNNYSTGWYNTTIKDSSYTDATAFKSAMNGVYLVYELSEYEETPITTASLVTENGEIALKSEDDYLVGECNSDISENAGFIDAKVKLSDADGEIYSNKIQIHVERRP